MMKSAMRNYSLIFLLLIALIHGSGALCNSKVCCSSNFAQFSPRKPAPTTLKHAKMTDDDNNDDDEAQFDSLDVVLDRARKRNQIPLALGKLQAALDRRVLPFLSVGDVILILAAIVLLDLTWFAVGLVLGKATVPALRQKVSQQYDDVGTFVMKLLDFYPALLAIILDQVFD